MTTNLKQLVEEMELGHVERTRLACELLQLRRVASECRRHQRRLPPSVQAALRAPVRVYELEPPPEGTPGLFHPRSDEATSAG